MEKQEMLNLLERFEAISKECEFEEPHIVMNLELTVKAGFVHSHYIYVCNKKNGKDFLCSIKGFNRITSGRNEVETFNDVLKVLEREENE